MPTMPAPSRSPLFKALHARQRRKMDRLLHAGASPDETDIDGVSLVHLACTSDQPLALASLLAHGANPNVWDMSGHTPLGQAVYKNDETMTTALLNAGVDPTRLDSPYRVWNTPLYLGAMRGSLACLTLLEQWADEHQKCLDYNVGHSAGRTLLMAAVNNDQPLVVQWLVDRGADVDRRVGDLDDTALCLACKRCLPETLRVLISAGANPNLANRHGQTPLHLMSTISDVEVIPLIHALVAAGADPLATNKEGLTPYGMVASWPLRRDTPVGHAWLQHEEAALLRRTLLDVPARSIPSVRARL